MNRWIVRGLYVVLAATVLVLVCSTVVESWAKEVSLKQPHTVALVFGGGMTDQGEQTSMQADRVAKAAELYKAGTISQLIMTGDDGRNRSNEVEAMKAYAVSLGVPAEAIGIDGIGYNTRTSCINAADRGDEQLTVISQSFHLPRIVYFCDRYGVKTYPVAADYRDYGIVGTIWVAQVREGLARLKGVWQTEITKAGPIIIK